MEQAISTRPTQSVTHPLPFARSYWVEQGRFMAGYLPAHLDAEITERQCKALISCGIRRIIDLTEDGEVNHKGLALGPYESFIQRAATVAGCAVHSQRIPIPDYGVPDRMTMTRILDAIDAGLEANEPVYVHCWGGRGRTGTVVGCWLMRHRARSGDEALAMISRLRRGLPDEDYASPETEEQRRMVREWREG